MTAAIPKLPISIRLALLSAAISVLEVAHQQAVLRSFRGARLQSPIIVDAAKTATMPRLFFLDNDPGKIYPLSKHYVNPKFDGRPWFIDSNRRRSTDPPIEDDYGRPLRAHTQDRAWAHSQKLSPTDPNLVCRDRLSKGVVQGSDTIPAPSTSSSLWHMLGELVLDDDSVFRFKQKIRHSVQTTLRVLKSDSVRHRTRIDFGIKHAHVRRHTTENAALIRQLGVEYEVDQSHVPQPALTKELVRLYEQAIQHEFLDSWSKERKEAAAVFAETLAEAEHDIVWKSSLLRFEPFTPAKPYLKAEIAGLKIEGFRRGLTYTTEWKQMGSSYLKKIDFVPHFASDDEPLDDNPFDFDHLTSRVWSRETSDPIDRHAIEKHYQQIYNPQGDRRTPESERRVRALLRKDDPIVYVISTENWKIKNVAVAEGAKPNTISQRLIRRRNAVGYIEEITRLYSALPTEKRARGGNFVFVDLDRPRLRLLDIEKFRTSPQDDLGELEQRALDDLLDQTLKEAVRKADDNHDAIAQTIKRVRTAFSNVYLCYFPPVQLPQAEKEAA